MTLMLGGVIGGYWATGKFTIATAPPRVMTIDNTDAKIGRVMKKWENIDRPEEPLLALRVLLFGVRLQQAHQGDLGRRWRVLIGRVHGGAPLDALHAADDDAFVQGQAFLPLLAFVRGADDAQLADRLADLDRAV